MKKITWLIAGITLIVLLAACGGGDSSESGTEASGDEDGENLTLWYWNRGLDEAVLEKVEEEFPNVNFEAQNLPPGGDYKTNLTTLLASGDQEDAPDLALMNIWVSELLPHADRFVNLYDYGGEEIEENYPDWKTSQAITGDGEHMIAVPVDTSPTGYYYREDIFAEAGIADSPDELSEKISTWEGYLDVLTQLRDETGTYGVESLKNAFTVYINKLDQRYFDENDEFIGDQAHIKEVWDKVVELKERELVAGNIEAQSQEWNAAINNEQLVGYDGPVWAKDILMDTTPATEGLWRVARSPVADGNDGGSFLGVLETTNHPETAVEIARFINNEQNQIESYKNISLFPAHNDALESEEIHHEEEYFGGQNTTEVFAESAMNVQEAHRGPQETIATTAFRDELDLVATQDKDPEQAWEDALEKIERDLSL